MNFVTAYTNCIVKIWRCIIGDKFDLVEIDLVNFFQNITTSCFFLNKKINIIKLIGWTYWFLTMIIFLIKFVCFNFVAVLVTLWIRQKKRKKKKIKFKWNKLWLGFGQEKLSINIYIKKYWKMHFKLQSVIFEIFLCLFTTIVN